jgi:DNA-binding CsgD family transcriptional regulator
MPGSDDKVSTTTEKPRDLELGRDAYAGSDWEDAYLLLSRGCETASATSADFEKLAWAAALTGRSLEFLNTLEELYQQHLDAGDNLRAARAAFWLGLRLMALGGEGRAGGWLSRAGRLVGKQDCAERGYILLPTIHRHIGSGEYEAACDVAKKAAEIGDRFGDQDLAAFARCLLGRSRLRQGAIVAGLASLDDAMLAASQGELSPVITGLIYCSSIEACQEIFALDRCREWTTGLAGWCAAQPQLVAFTGSCLVHRAEVFQLSGAWADAIKESQRVAARFSGATDPEGVAEAYYQEAEIYRLRGEYSAAEDAYRNASHFGFEPQPGHSLLRLAQGRGSAALGAIRRVVESTPSPTKRVRFLPAYVEIALALGEMEEARTAAADLHVIAENLAIEVVAAMADHADGALRLAEGDAQGAQEPLRRAAAVWTQVGAPYLVAKLRVLMGRSCAALGDTDGSAMQFEAARAVFLELGASPDLTALTDGSSGVAMARDHGLTQRELQVLRLIAAGRTNKAIATVLEISEKTVDRHASNIFTKIDVPTRAAATAFAYRKGLI